MLASTSHNRCTGYPVSFYTLFEGQQDVVWSHAASPREAFTADLTSRFDVIVLHDMWEGLDPAARECLRTFVEAGKGIVSIHHAIVDYTAWPWWWQEVIGGKFFLKEQSGHPASACKEDVEMVVTPTALGASYPVTRDIPPLVVNDEAYRCKWHSPQIKVLMETALSRVRRLSAGEEVAVRYMTLLRERRERRGATSCNVSASWRIA